MVSAWEMIAVLTSILSVWLTAVRNLLCWPIGLFSVILYAFVFYRARLYSDFGLQIVFGLCILYGWRQWAIAGQERDRVPVEKLDPFGRFLSIVAGILGSLVLGFVMATYTNAAAPWLDALLGSFSLVAQFWAARRFVENWPLWIGIDLAYIYLYISKQLYLTAALYAVFVVLAAVGWRSWRTALSAPPARSEPGNGFS